MAAIDYNSLRQTTLGSGRDEEAVTVNTRALVHFKFLMECRDLAKFLLD